MNAKSMDDLIEIEADFFNELRNNMYNELLKIKEIKKERKQQ